MVCRLAERSTTALNEFIAQFIKFFFLFLSFRSRSALPLVYYYVRIIKGKELGMPHYYYYYCCKSIASNRASLRSEKDLGLSH